MVLPYLKGSSLYILVLFMVNVWIYLVFKGLSLKLNGLSSLISIKVYYKWYHRYFLGTKWEIFFSFCIFFVEKGGRKHSG
jgi:hypothetical protein